MVFEGRRKEGALMPIEPHYDLGGGADCRFSSGAPALGAALAGMHPSAQHPERFKHCSSLLRLKKMSRDKTPGNLKYKRSDTWSLGSGECAQLRAKQ